MNAEIHRADARLRRLTLLVLSSALIVAVLSISMFHRWLERSTLVMPTAEIVAELRRTIGFAMAGCGACLLLLAGYAARTGSRVIEERRWPLRSTRVVRDTVVRSGKEAVVFGRMLNMAAIVLIALAIGCAVVSGHLLGGT